MCWRSLISDTCRRAFSCVISVTYRCPLPLDHGPNCSLSLTCWSFVDTCIASCPLLQPFSLDRLISLKITFCMNPISLHIIMPDPIWSPCWLLFPYEAVNLSYLIMHQSHRLPGGAHLGCYRCNLHRRLWSPSFDRSLLPPMEVNAALTMRVFTRKCLPATQSQTYSTQKPLAKSYQCHLMHDIWDRPILVRHLCLLPYKENKLMLFLWSNVQDAKASPTCHPTLQLSGLHHWRMFI